MTKQIFVLVFLIVSLSLAAFAEEKKNVEPFGEVRLYKPAAKATSLVLLISGDGGWEDKVAKMAEGASASGAFVVGIDIDQYLGPEKHRDWSGCPFMDLEKLTAQIRQTERLGEIGKPILMGYSSGATLAYAALLEAPGSFSGAVTLGFCPDLHGAKICTGEKLKWHRTVHKSKPVLLLEPETQFSVRWVAIQGEMDIACGPRQISAFIQKVPGAEMVTVKNVTHGFNVPGDWLSYLIDGLRKIEKSAAP